MRMGVNFFSAMYKEAMVRRKEERKRKTRANQVRADQAAPLSLGIGNIVKVSTIVAYSIPEASLLNDESLTPFLSVGAVIKNYGCLRHGMDVFHRSYFEEDGQEYMIQCVTDRVGNIQSDQMHIFMLHSFFVPEIQEHVDLYLKKGEGILGDPNFGIPIEGMDEPLVYSTIWGSERFWTDPVEVEEKIWDDPYESAMTKAVHTMGFFRRQISEAGEMEFALNSATKFYDNPLKRIGDYDRLAMLLYVGLPISASDIEVIRAA